MPVATVKPADGGAPLPRVLRQTHPASTGNFNNGSLLSIAQREAYDA